MTTGTFRDKPAFHPKRFVFPGAWQDAAARLLAIVLLGALLTLVNPHFLTGSNIFNVLRQTALLFLIASGLTLVVLSAGIDLSVGANAGLSACLAAVVLKTTGSIPLGICTACLSGTCIGLCNGLIVTLLRVPPFIATYGSYWILLGSTYWFMGGESIHGFPANFRVLGTGYWWGIPVPVFIMLLFLAMGTVFLTRTRWGQEVYAIGANPVAARLSGIPVESRITLVYTVSGAMAGLAALVFLARLNSAEGDIGESLTLPAVTAVLAGGTSLFGGSGSVWGTLTGALLLTLIINGMNLLSVSTNWQPFANGTIIILAVLLDRILLRRDR